MKSPASGKVFASKLSVSSTAEAGSARNSAFAGAIYTQGEAEDEAAVSMFGPSNFFDELRWGKSTALQAIASGDLLRDRGASFRKVILTRIDKVSRIEQYSQVDARTIRSPLTIDTVNTVGRRTEMAQALSDRLPASETHVLKMLSQGAPVLEILNELCNFIDARSPGVIPTVLLPGRDGHLRLAAGPKVPKHWNETFTGLKVPSNPSFHRSRRQEKSGSVSGVTSDPTLAACCDLALSGDIQAAWSAPILSKDGKILGALVLFYPTPHSPGELDLELMEQTINIASIAIECHRNEEELREFSRRLYQSQDEERRRIARELHDSTGQKLAALAMNLWMVRGAIPAPPPELEELLLQCASLITSISDELRTLSYLLQPPMLDERGSNTAIQWYVDGINQRNGLRVEVEIPRQLRRMSEEAELAIFRIVQASLTNVHLHSGATEAKVKIEQNLDGLIVTVSDEGIPNGVLDHSSRTKTVGIGIKGMRERVKQLDGYLEIETNGNGTKVKATIPSRHFSNHFVGRCSRRGMLNLLIPVRKGRLPTNGSRTSRTGLSASGGGLLSTNRAAPQSAPPTKASLSANPLIARQTLVRSDV